MLYLKKQLFCFSFKPHLLSQQKPRGLPDQPRWRITILNYTFCCTFLVEIICKNPLDTGHILHLALKKSSTLQVCLTEKKMHFCDDYSMSWFWCHWFTAVRSWEMKVMEEIFFPQCQMSFWDLILKSNLQTATAKEIALRWLFNRVIRVERCPCSRTQSNCINASGPCYQTILIATGKRQRQTWKI